jgi:4-hydroxy-3-methylbut-2-enyl diphosphate reductase IspH
MLTLRVTRGKLEVDTECMNAGFCAGVVKQAIAEAETAGKKERAP